MLSRREVLERGAAIAGPALLLGRVPGAEALGNPPTVEGMNIVIFITDQQRYEQHFPPGWSRRHLPGMTRLRQNGLTFENAFCSASMCSPSRASLLTGYFSAQHGVKYTLEQTNLAAKSYQRTPAQEKQYIRLRAKLARVKRRRLQPLPTTPKPLTRGNPDRRAPLSSLD
jgi:hypothetical protein